MMMIRSAIVSTDRFYASTRKFHAPPPSVVSPPPPIYHSAMRLPRQDVYAPRSTGPPWWRTRFWSMSGWIIAINIVVFIADVLSFGRLTQWGCLSGSGILRVQVWRLITFQFLHAGPIHLIFNMLWFYLLGPLVEWRMGKRRFLTFYLICGVAGGAAFLIQWW